MFEFKIKSLDKNESLGEVHAVWFDVWKKEEGQEKKFTHGISLDYDSSSESFVKFEELTEQHVVEWVKAALDEKELEVQYNRVFPEIKLPSTPWN
jgi:hypothetical protein